jgi:AraC-like DNA-binding protein
VPETSSPSLRERTRRAVQAELVEVAQRLFVERGYEQTTADAIAGAAGMSKRSLFRYFRSEEDLVEGGGPGDGGRRRARDAVRPTAALPSA